MCIRQLLQIAALMPLLLCGLTPSAGAQVMKRDRFTIPWFRSAAEQRARDACLNNQPDCRPSVRDQIDQEKAISLLAPWGILGIAILGVLFWLRKLEQDKNKKLRDAQRKHDPKAYKKLDQTKEDRAAETAKDEDY